MLWHRHGLVTNGKTVDEAYGKVLTVEHAMLGLQMALAASSPDEIQWLEKEQLGDLVNKFDITPRSAVWDSL